MEKKEAIKEIFKLMRLYGISITDLLNVKKADFLPRKFDLLCENNGRMQRVPFDEGVSKSPLGLFPFADRNYYLEFAQQTNKVRAEAKEEKLPERDFWVDVFYIRDDINAQLELLEQPLLKGAYFARGGKLNWIVKMTEETEIMPENFYPDDTPANICYIGNLKH